MKLYGSITENLEHAVASAQRLRGHPVYKETLTYWAELLQDARRERQLLTPPHLGLLEAAIVRLEEELADRAK